MGRTKPNKPSKSPNKRIEEDEEQDPSINVTPQNRKSRHPRDEIISNQHPNQRHLQGQFINDETLDKLNRERKLKGLQSLYREDDLLTTINTQGNNISKPGMRHESSPTQDDRKIGNTKIDINNSNSRSIHYELRPTSI
jgi:hypothetical protein